MKKFLIPIILAVFTGFIMAKVVFSQYEHSNLQTVFTESESINLIQIGVYSSKKNMEENTKNFDYYIYNEQDGMYYVYVGITKDENNLTKLKNYFNNLGYDVYVKTTAINNQEFLDLLMQYDELLTKTNDNETIKTINSKILKKYEELVL